MATLTIEFRRILEESSRDHDHILGRIEAPDVSFLPGEIVNIRGYPYRVAERGWAVNDDDGRLYCYVRLR